MSVPDWSVLRPQDDEDDHTRVLEHAHEDLDACAATLLRGDHYPALTFDVTASDFTDARTGELTVEVKGPKHGREIKLGHSVILRAARKGITPLGLIAYAVTAPKQLDNVWRPKRIGQALPLTADQLESHRRVYRYTPAAGDAEATLDRERDVLVVGDHGSGRSALAATLADRYRSEGLGVVWLDLTDPADGPESVVSTLLQTERADAGYLLVVNGLQANLPIVRHVFGCVQRLREQYGLSIRVLATSWTSVARLLQQSKPESGISLHRVRIDGSSTINIMLTERTEHPLDEDDKARIRELAAKDVHIAASAIEFFNVHGRVPSESDLQREYAGGLTDPNKQHALYYLACLGALDLALPQWEAEHLFGVEHVEELRVSNLVRRTDDAYTVGPRRRAQLVIQHAVEFWQAGRHGQPEDIVWRHLQRAGERQIRATFSRIDKIVSPDELRPESLYLLSSWERLDRVGSWLERSTIQDPTWGDNLESAVFAAMALRRLHRDELWKAIAEPIRAAWRYDDPNLDRPEPTGQFVNGFDVVAKHLRLEDQVFGADGHPSGMPADEVDLRRAYRNWVLGLLLSLESTAPVEFRDEWRIDLLVAMAGRARDTHGGFHPARFPWITAQVVIGLCEAGQRDDDPVVHDACRWLLELIGDASEAAWWRGGAGSWRGDEATTAMCLIALLSGEIPGRKAMDTAFEWLASRKREWAAPGRETDLAQVVAAMAARGGSAALPHLKTLLSQFDRELGSSGSAPLRPAKRSRLPFIAAQLANVVWLTAQAECGRLFRDVVTPRRTKGSATTVPTPASAGSAPDQAQRQQPRQAAANDDADPGSIHTNDEHDGSVEQHAGVLTAYQLRLWRDAANQLRDTLNGLITKRSGVVSTVPSVQERLTELRAQRNQYQELVRHLDAATPKPLLIELDELGRGVCGQAWPDLPFPDSSPDSGEENAS